MGKYVSIRELAAWLQAHDDYVLLSHVYPDGDAVGSCMAMQMALHSMGKRAFICLPGGMPRMFSSYPQADTVLEAQADFPFVPRSAFSLDAADYTRFPADIFNSCEARAMLDHHETNRGFGDVWHVDGKRIANGELVYELIRALDVDLTKDMAEWLYIAISTDSGHFRFKDTTGETMRIAAELVDAGIDVPRLTNELHFTRSLGKTRLMAAVINDMHICAGGEFSWARLTGAMRESCGALPEDKDGMVNLLLEVEGVELAVLVEEREGESKFSLRSKYWLNVGEICRQFGGGGHYHAAGFSLKMPMEDAVNIVIEKLEAELKSAKQQENA